LPLATLARQLRGVIEPVGFGASSLGPDDLA